MAVGGTYGPPWNLGTWAAFGGSGGAVALPIEACIAHPGALPGACCSAALLTAASLAHPGAFAGGIGSGFAAFIPLGICGPEDDEESLGFVGVATLDAQSVLPFLVLLNPSFLIAEIMAGVRSG